MNNNNTLYDWNLFSRKKLKDYQTKKLKILLDIVRKSTIIMSFCLELLIFFCKMENLKNLPKYEISLL